MRMLERELAVLREGRSKCCRQELCETDSTNRASASHQRGSDSLSQLRLAQRISSWSRFQRKPPRRLQDQLISFTSALTSATPWLRARSIDCIRRPERGLRFRPLQLASTRGSVHLGAGLRASDGSATSEEAIDHASGHLDGKMRTGEIPERSRRAHHTPHQPAWD
jgi:hypothetical protein